jgi:hypothetical protein
LASSGAVGDFTARFGQRLTLFQGHDQRQVFLRFHHQVEPLAQAGGTLFCGSFTPFGEGSLGGFDSAARFRGAAFGDFGDNFTIGRIGYRHGCATVCVHPFTIDICPGFEQGLVGYLNTHVHDSKKFAGKARSITISLIGNNDNQE